MKIILLLSLLAVSASSIPHDGGLPKLIPPWAVICKSEQTEETCQSYPFIYECSDSGQLLAGPQSSSLCDINCWCQNLNALDVKAKDIHNHNRNRNHKSIRGHSTRDNPYNASSAYNATEVSDEVDWRLGCYTYSGNSNCWRFGYGCDVFGNLFHTADVIEDCEDFCKCWPLTGPNSAPNNTTAPVKSRDELKRGHKEASTPAQDAITPPTSPEWRLSCTTYWGDQICDRYIGYSCDPSGNMFDTIGLSDQCEEDCSCVLL